MNFQRSVVLIATVILIGTLTFIGISINRQSRNEIYPPVVADCPDYWEAEPSNGDPTKPICKNTHNIGSSNCPTTMNFNSGEFVGEGGLCEKQKWAKNCNLTWDGVTNSNRKC
jgi:hypothetical protein